MSLLSNPIFLGVMGIAVIATFGYLFFKKRLPVTEILYCRERDRRGERLLVAEETAHSLRVERKGLLGKSGSPLRFIKLTGSYVFNEGGKMVNKFFCKEGTAYTWWLEGEDMKVGTLYESLLKLWGEKFYGEIPAEQRKMVEDKNVYVTVKLGEGSTPDGFSPISEEDITYENDLRAAKVLSSGIRERTTGKALYEGLLWCSVGFALCFALYNFGVFT